MPSHFAKKNPPYGDPIAYPKDIAPFMPWPPRPAGKLILPLKGLFEAAADAVKEHGQLVFHAVGDTGGVDGTESQERIADAMQQQIREREKPDRPRFFYLLGDVVYQNGSPDEYRTQFYKPYKYYDAPIVSVPGNHDGYGRSPHVAASSLDGWRENFLGEQPPERRFPYRAAMDLPYVFWMLETSVANLIGLYSNTEGFLDGPNGHPEQRDWLEERLRETPADRAAIVVVHHPPYSLDDKHHGAPAVGEAIDVAARASGRWPDLVLSGHVHSYQRFTRRVDGREIPYLVAGAGGRASDRNKLSSLMEWENKPAIKIPFKTLPRDPSLDVELVAHDWTDPGFLTFSIDANEIRCTYWQVPFDPERPVDWQDSFTLDLKTHKIRVPQE